jgi:DNA-binding MarR family transcriptional regulator
LGFKLGLVHRTLRGVWQQRIADLDVTPPQAAVLRTVAEEGPAGMRALARRMGTDAMNLKRLVAHLERAGLVRRETDPWHSQRRVIRATEAGQATSKELSRRVALLERRLADAISCDALARLKTLLDELQRVLSTASTFSADGVQEDTTARPGRKR